MQKVKSQIPFDYITIKTTKSRIEKGLLAIPISLIDLFPRIKSQIYLVNENGQIEAKSFTPYSSSSRECRIGGLKKFYAQNRIKDGDEVIIQILDDKKYRIIPAAFFEKKILSLERKIDKATSEEEVEDLLLSISNTVNKNYNEISKSEFVRLTNERLTDRKTKIVSERKTKENVPVALRKILQELYGGKCQVSQFTFLRKDGNPYFEIHHIDPYKGNHVKNLLVVSPNVHKQFTYANVKHFFDKDNWLRKVKFNDQLFSVFQIIDELPKDFVKQVHYLAD